MRTFMTILAICGASYRKENHKPSFALMKSSAAVQYAYCTCKAGEGGWCNPLKQLAESVSMVISDTFKTS